MTFAMAMMSMTPLGSQLPARHTVAATVYSMFAVAEFDMNVVMTTHTAVKQEHNSKSWAVRQVL